MRPQPRVAGAAPSTPDTSCWPGGPGCPPSQPAARSIADHGRPSGRGLLICHDRLGGSNSPKSHPHTWNPSEHGVGSRFKAGTLPVRALLHSRRASPRVTRSDMRPTTIRICSHRPGTRKPHTYCALAHLSGMVCKIGTLDSAHYLLDRPRIAYTN